MGVTLTVMKLDDELESCLKAPCRSVGLTVAGELPARRIDGTSGGTVAGVAGSGMTTCSAKPAMMPRTILLHEAALAASGSTLTARSRKQYRTCPVKDSCPIQPEGRRAVA